jgi:hypothetical protein
MKAKNQFKCVLRGKTITRREEEARTIATKFKSFDIYPVARDSSNEILE